MVLDTTADVDEIEAVSDRNGDRRPAANADKQDVANARLGNAAGVFTDTIDPSTSGEPLPSHAVKQGQEVLVFADPSNSGPIYVGKAGGTATFPLTKDNGLTFAVDNTDALRAKADTSGDTLHIVGESA
ncbi:hypothetical protein [Halobaculum sp. EA56]|uniref:hypothetical protein n=1 Tax=Halobaculum sp. EA56 TaxID=3421648 RepID=UPI003EB7C0B3